MSEPFLSEIKIVSFNFPPKGWALCNGQLLPINQNQALFALLGTTYGGNGQTNFALPNLRGRVPIHMGSGHTLGEAAGAVRDVNIQQLPTHTHPVRRPRARPPRLRPTHAMLGQCRANMLQPARGNLSPWRPTASPSVGGSQPHNNMMPYLVLNFFIALQGIFPSQN